MGIALDRRRTTPILVEINMASADMTPIDAAAEFDLLATLRRYWGYGTFRPLQERIVTSLLGGHDTCVVMPTGGGKSLCYQLPAVMLGRTVIVVSPLIALMQDQVAQLAQMGIPAAVLNSSLTNEKQAEVVRKPPKAPSACSIFPRNAWRGPIPSSGCNAYRSRFSPSTRRTAFPSGATSSARSTGS